MLQKELFMIIYYLIGTIIIIIFIALFRKLLHLTSGTLFFGLTGVIIGALIGALLSGPLSRLPGIYGQWLPLVISVIFAVVLAFVFVSQKETISEWFFFRFISKLEKRLEKKAPEIVIKEGKKEKKMGGIVVDTSVMIDGRIGDITKTGFVTEKLIIPRFVLEELQKVADSEEPMRRNRGRRGLEILNNINKESSVEVEITEQNYPKIKKVDAKLVRLAKERKAYILTTDYNLNRVAGIEGVKVLNVNELANAIKTVVLPGEELKIKIIQEGKEKGQGVGYLEDGTMVVIEGGAGLVGKEVTCEVARIFQTVAGKMIFTRPKNQRTSSSK